MMNRILRRAVFGLSFFTFFLTLPVQAQLVIRGDPIRQLESKSGRTVKAEFAVENRSDVVQGGSLKIKAVKNDRDMSSWITIADPYFNVPARSIVRIKYRIVVPDEVKGSYWTKFVLLPTALRTSGTVNIRIEYVSYVVLDCPGGTAKLKFVDMKVVDNKVIIDVKNVGTLAMRPTVMLYADGQPFSAKKKLIFPNQSTTWTVDITGLPKGRHSIVVVTEDPKGMFGIRSDVEIGVETVTEISTFVPIRIRLSSDIGPEGLRSLVRTSATFGRYRIGLGGFAGQRSSRLDLNVGYTTRKLSANVYTYRSNNRWQTSIGTILNLRPWFVSLNTRPFEETGNLSIRYAFNRGYVGLRTSLNQRNVDWTLTASIPFEIQLRFKKKIKQKPADLKTIIFQK